MRDADQYDQDADDFSAQTRIAEETEARLAADPAVQAWLKQFYRDGSGLLGHYASEKAKYLVVGPGWLADEESQGTRWLTEAYERLWQVQQKKLFDYQCEWRANVRTLPGVETGAEFAEWGHDITRCPLLTPISAGEFALYLDYLQSADCVDVGAGTIGQPNWQEYDLFRQWEQLREAGSASPGHDLSQALPPDMRSSVGNLFNLIFRYPEWYAYHDRHQDNAPLLHLPDERGPNQPAPTADETEEKQELAEANLPAGVVPPPAGPPLRHLNANDLQLTETLLKHFESRELLGYMRAVEFLPEQDEKTEAVYGVYQELCEVQEDVPIRAGADWRECLRLAQLEHEKRQLAQALRAVYREYCLREATGIAHPTLPRYDAAAD